MKILYISLNISESQHGAGGWVRTINILKQLQNSKIDLDILTTEKGKFLLEKEGINKFNYIVLQNKILELPKTEIRLIIFFNWLIYLINFILFKKKLNLKGYKFVYSDSDFFIDIIPNLIIAKSNKCLNGCAIHHLITINNFKLDQIFNNFVSLFIQKLSFQFIKKFDAIFVYKNPEGIRIESFLRKNYNFRGKIHKMYNGVDIKTLDYINNLKIKKKNYDIFFYGAARRNKGFYDLIEIFNLVLKFNKQAKLNIAGMLGNSELLYLKSKIKKYKLKNKVKILGYLIEKEKFIKIKSSQVVIFPSYNEGWGISIMESRYLNPNVVCYNLKSLTQIHKKNICFAKIGNKEDFVNKIILLLKKNKVLINNYIKKYNWRNCADMDITFIRALILKN
jgi:glycosyltransferase involved in cell wall biosynthesis